MGKKVKLLFVVYPDSSHDIAPDPPPGDAFAFQVVTNHDDVRSVIR